MKLILSSYLFCLWLYLNPLHVIAQCCSGGVPMAGNLGMPIAEAKTLQLSLSYDYNSLKTFLTGRSNADESFQRQRNTVSYLLETSYTFNQWGSLDILLPYVRQERKIQGNLTSTEGVGDVVVLPKVTLKKNFVLGLGIKIPVGNTDHTVNGIPVIIDLQPGSGAWDLVYHFSYNLPSIPKIPSASFFTTVNIRNPGVNDRYLNDLTYEFGTEYQVITALSNRFTLFKSVIIDGSLKFRFRQAEKDTTNGTLISNTGGRWVFINPGIAYIISKGLSAQTNIELPIYEEVGGTQLSPTLRINTGLFFSFKKDAHEKSW